jgi:SnoaL-like domain
MSEVAADIEAIKQLKARYFRLMDTKDWAAFREVFAPDVVVDVSADGGGTYEGVAPFLEMLEPTLRDVVTVHHGHMPEIELTSPTTATGVWAMEDLLRFSDGGPVATVHGWGHYHDTYVKLDGTWRIASTRLTRLRIDVT